MEALLQFKQTEIIDDSQVAVKKDVQDLFFTKHIVKVGRTSVDNENDYSLDNILFTNLSISNAIIAIKSPRKIDGILINPEQTTTQFKALKEKAKEKLIPLILYTSTYELTAKKLALSKGMDDYFYGNLTEASLKRISFIHKLKAYKNKRGDTPYQNPKVEDAVPKIKLWTFKRAFDVFVSGTAIILISPLLILIALLVKLDSKGPIFYISKRAGSGYRIFDFYKFRTMRVGADSDLSKLSHLNQYSEQVVKTGVVFFKLKNDPRVTRLGQFLRDTSMDELPQFVNVLLGDMSLVGNRPLPLYEAKQLTKDQIAWRFLAPAGITGLWQITKRGKDNMSEDERIQLDMEYAIKNSFLYDMKILVGTLPALLQKQRV